MKLIETSLQIALRAYAGKTDKAGREYILHPLRVMAKMNTDLERSAALLHDVLEDSDIAIISGHHLYHAGELNQVLSIYRGQAWEETEEVEENNISTLGHRVKPPWLDTQDT